MNKSQLCVYGPCGRCEFNDCFDGGTMYDPEYNYFDNDEDEEDCDE